MATRRKTARKTSKRRGSATKRRTAAKKSAATRKRKSAKRSAAGKKAWRTRRRNATKRSTAAKKAARKRSKTTKRRPARRKTVRRKTGRRKTRSTSAKRSAAAKKAWRTRRRNATKRSRAAKRGARGRKRTTRRRTSRRRTSRRKGLKIGGFDIGGAAMGLLKTTGVLATVGLTALVPYALVKGVVSNYLAPNLPFIGAIGGDLGIVVGAIATLLIGGYSLNWMNKNTNVLKTLGVSKAQANSGLLFLTSFGAASQIQAGGIGSAFTAIVANADPIGAVQALHVPSLSQMMDGTPKILGLGAAHNNQVGQNYTSQNNNAGLYQGNSYGSVSGRIFGTPSLGATKRMNLF